jgi:hypothetical protein
MHVHREYPKWKYHRIEAARIVHDPAADDALGAEWAEAPFPPEEPEAPATATATEAPKKKTRKG